MTDTTEISKMDSLSDAIYVLHFKNEYLDKKGTAFQDWFAELAKHAYGSDFEAIRNYGNQGDWKCDGRLVKSGTIFQCYAPGEVPEREVISKINEDFAGAQLKWPNFMNVWVFVHNDKRGVPPKIANHLDTLRSDNPTITVEIWEESNLLDLFEMMSLNAKRLMFGEVPTRETLNDLTLPGLAPVIDALKEKEPNPNDPLPPPPSPQKLAKNALSKEATLLLSLGRRKVKLVETFLNKDGLADKGEKIAESFRQYYDELKALELDVDTIFTHLHKHVGVYAEPAKQAAAMAILAYFFDSCDIFEDPTEEDTVI